MDGIPFNVARLHHRRVERVGNWGSLQTLGHYGFWSTNVCPLAVLRDHNKPLVPLCAWNVCNPGNLVSARPIIFVLIYED